MAAFGIGGGRGWRSSPRFLKPHPTFAPDDKVIRPLPSAMR